MKNIAAKFNSRSKKKLCNYIADIKRSDSCGLKKEEIAKKIRFNELFVLKGEYPLEEFAGACFENVHYYDFKNVKYINNNGLAGLIDILKCFLERGVTTQFVNVDEKIKRKIKLLGLEGILNCS